MIKCGIDIVLNKRLAKNLTNPDFLMKVFLPIELKTHEKKKLPGIFALKEATMKAVGKKLNWLDIEVLAKNGKKPEIKISGKKFKNIDSSVSHDGEYTVAMVVGEV